MEIDHRREDNICIVSINGNLDLHSFGVFQSYMLPFIEDQTIKGVALNFTKVEFLDSSGIAHVVATFRSLEKRGAKLAIYNMRQKYNRMFKMMGLDKACNLQETEEEFLINLKGNNGN